VAALQHAASAFELRVAAVCLALAGKLNEAKRFAALVRQSDPRRLVSNLQDWQRDADVERYKEGLRLAGLPE